MAAGETELERLVVRLVGDMDQYLKALKQTQAENAASMKAMEAELKKLEATQADVQSKMAADAAKSAADQGQSYDATKKKLKELGEAFVTAGASLAGFLLQTRSAVMAAGQFEQTQIAFETMLGSAKDSNKLLADLTKFAAETPFEMPQLEAAARQMIAFGERGDSIIRTLKLIGNAAAASGANFNEIALIFNQVRGAGKVMWEDFQQLTQRGVLSLQDLGDQFGVTAKQAREMMKNGEISFEDFRKVFERLSQEGGRFSGALEKQSKSLLGLFSTLRDALGLINRELGQVLAPAVKFVTEKLMALADEFRKLPEWVKAGVAVTVALAAALGSLLLVAGLVTIALSKVVGVLGAYSVAAIAATAATAGYVVAVGAGLTYVAHELGREIFGVTEDMKKLNEATKQAADLNQKWVNKFTKQTEEIMAAAGRKPNAGEKQTFLEEELRKAQLELAGYTAAVKGAENQVKELDTRWNRWTGNEMLKLTNKELEDQNKRLEAAKLRVEKLNAELQKTKAPEQNLKLMDDVAEFNQKLRETISAFGMAANEAKLFKFQMDGLTGAALAESTHLVKTARDVEELNAAYKKITETTEAFRKAAEPNDAKSQQNRMRQTLRELQERFRPDLMARDPFGKPERLDFLGLHDLEQEIRLLKAALPVKLLDPKLTPEMKKQIEDQQRLTLRLLETAMAYKQLEQAVQDAERVRITKEVTARGNELIKQFRTPLKIMEDAQAELRDLFERGVIDRGTFDRGMEAARQEFEKVGKEAKKATSEIQKFDAALFGSAEAITRLQKQQDLLFGPFRRVVPPPVNVAPAPRAAGEPVPVEMGMRDAGDGRDKAVELLARINDNIVKLTKRVEAAGGLGIAGI